MATHGTSHGLSIKAIEPTIYFVEDGGALQQGVDVLIVNPGASAACRVAVTLDGKAHEHDLGAVGAGETTHRITIPDVREEKPVSFRLLVEGAVVDERTVGWRPQRHWTVYVVQFAHFDPGYTDLPSNVMAEYLGFLDDVVAWCEQTTDWPDEAKFRYVVEQSWVAHHYVRHRPPEMVERFVRCCRAGQIELTAFFANMTSDLLGAEEAARLLYPAFEFTRRYGIPIRVAEHNDVPGMAWSLATALVEAGIKYFMPGVPGYFSARYVGEKRAAPHPNFDSARVQPHDCPVAFRWEAQEGHGVLVYLHRQGCGGGVDTNLAELPGVLAKADAEGYAYDVFLYRLIGGHRDNAPPLFGYAETVKAWNERWAYPKLVVATDSMFFDALEKQLGDEVPTYRGHWPDTDYALGSTSTAEALGVNRAAKEMLIAGERLATIASTIAGHDYPREPLDAAYISALKFDEHAWGLARPFGWASDAHRGEKSLYAQHAAAFADDVLTKSANIIADQVALEDDGHHIVVFNSLGHARTDVVEVPFVSAPPCGMPVHLVEPPPGDPRAPIWVGGTVVGRRMNDLPWQWANDEAGLELVDVATGTVVAHQLVRVPDSSFPMRTASERDNSAQRAQETAWLLQFVASDVPAVGYRTYRLVQRGNAASAASELRVTATALENESYRVTLDEKTGAVASIFDKELDRELVDVAGEFGVNECFARGVAAGVIARMTDVTITPVRCGPVAVSLLVKGSLAGAPEVVGEVVLYRGIKRIDFFNRLLKDADSTRAYFVAFPFRVERPRFRFEAGLNVVRPIEDQFPGTTTDYYAAQHWVHVGDGDGEWGIAWSAREAPLVQLGGNWHDYISPAHHGVRPDGFDHKFLTDPSQFTTGHIYSYLANNNYVTNCALSQPGLIHTSYSFTSSRGDWTGGRARRFGWGFCGPMPHAHVIGRQSGPLPVAYSFCAVDKANVVITTLKRAEDGDGLIVRLVETEGVEADVTVDVLFATLAKAVQTNIVEEGEARVLPCDGTRFTAHLAPWQVATVRLTARTA